MTKSPVSKRSQATRASILNAAKEVMGSHGFDAAKTSDIAKHAGLAEGTVFLHFDNKQGLLQALLQDVFGHMLDGAKEICAEQRPALDTLKLLGAHYINLLETNWPVAKLVVGNHARYSDEQSREQLDDYNRQYTMIYLALIQQLIDDGTFRRDIEPRRLRDAFFGGIEHFAIANFQQDREYNITQVLEEMWKILFHGALSEKPSHDTLRLEQKLDEILSNIKTIKPHNTVSK